MRISDGWSWFEFVTAWSAVPSDSQPVPSREVARVLGSLGGLELESVWHLLVSEYGWPGEQQMRPVAVRRRVLELISAGRLRVVAWVPNATVAGEVPDEDDVQELSDLVAEEDDDYGAADAVEPPDAVEADFEIEPPDAQEVEVTVEPPQMMEVSFEVA